VCDRHGGKKPEVVRSAQQRLLAHVDPAIDALFKTLRSHGPPCEHCGRGDGARDPVVVTAARVVLDRCGFHPSMALQVTTAPSEAAPLTRRPRQVFVGHSSPRAARARSARCFNGSKLTPRSIDWTGFPCA
jgi:hypothetical protein